MDLLKDHATHRLLEVVLELATVKAQAAREDDVRDGLADQEIVGEEHDGDRD